MKLAKVVCVCAIGLMPVAQAEEEKVWYCTEVASAGLTFNDGMWKMTNFRTERHTIKQFGDRLILPKALRLRKDVPSASCVRDQLLFPQVINCHEKSSTFNLNTHTGKATHSRAWGWAGMAKDSPTNGGNMAVVALECETF